jgi:hypothetical protein
LVGLLNNSAALAQNKEVRTSIMIINGDTIVNGKKFSQLPEGEKVELRKNFKGLSLGQMKMSADVPGHKISKVIVVKSDGMDSVSTGEPHQRVFNFNDGNQRMHIQIKTDTDFNDTEGHNMERQILIRKKGMQDMQFNMERPENGIGASEMSKILQQLPERGRMNFARPNKPNSSHFDYANTDKDGFTTRTEITVMEPNKANLKAVFKNENLAFNTLTVNDLVLSPNFSAGKTILSFSTAAKSTLVIKLVDTDGNILFSESKSVSGTYSKSFAWPKNGIYYLEISEAGKSYIRKLIKE